MEEAQKRFEEIASPPETTGGGKQPRKRKVVKPIVPKSK
jgi:hypothetical protein